MSEQENSQDQERVAPEKTSAPEAASASVEPRQSVEAVKLKGVVLPAKKYRLKIALLFLDLWAAIVFGYVCMILNIANDVNNKEFSWVSLSMIANYVVVGITLAALITGFILFKTRSVRTRIERDNELRQDQNISVWLTTFDWTWLVLFVPSMVVLILCGIAGYVISWATSVESPANLIVHRALGGFAFGFLCLNAAVVIFKLTPTRVLVLLLAIGGFCLILLLMGPRIFLNFFERFKHLGVKVDPLGYLLMAYVGFFYLRLIWIAGLFEYMALAPNRLDPKGSRRERKRHSKKGFPSQYRHGGCYFKIIQGWQNNNKFSSE